jgi:hypothetical protein
MIFKISYVFRVLLVITQNAQESKKYLLNRSKYISVSLRRVMSITVIYQGVSLTVL